MTDERVLVLMPTARDGERTRAALEGAGLVAGVCADFGTLCREISAGAGLALLTEEVLVDGAKALKEALRSQPPWSDFPLVVLAREGAADRGLEIREAMNATLVERPVKVRSLLSVVRAALRARRHQYAMRDHLAEQARVQATQAYLVRLGDVLRPLSDPDEVQAAASRLLGGHLGTNRVAYFEIVGEEYVVEQDYANGVVSLAGRYPVSSFGDALVASFRAGRTVVEADATAHPGRSETERAAFAAIRVRGHVDVPLVKDGAFVAGMTVHMCDARAWTADEVAVIEQTAERTWAAVERARAERSLRESEERFRSLFEAMDEGYCVIDMVFDAGGRATDFRYLLTNPALVKQTGLRDIVGKTVWEVLPGFDPRTIAAYGRAATTGEQVRFVEYVADLSRWYEVSAFPVGGGLVGVLFADVTARKCAEQELRDADRKKDDFIALLAHELRNPLAPLRNGLQVLRRSSDPAARERSQEMMDRQLAHMVRLIDDLLDVSRVGRNKMELRRGRVALSDVIASAVETAQPAIEAAGHELSVTLPGRPVDLDADLTRLAQVFSNLLTNSAKYTPRGGRIWLTADYRGDSVSVSVRDTGIGIPPASLPTIFDMFSQVDRSIERTTGGLGIGLALVKGLTEMHGGTVTAASDGTGSTFTVRLPALAAKPAVRTDPPPVTPNGVSRKILVADDNRDGAESLSQLLEVLGHRVRTVYDGVEAVEAAGEYLPDVILMDVGMPRLNGYEATRQIRARDWGAGVTIIALTGWGQDGDRQLSKEAGCDGHLVKPVGLPDLERILGEVRTAGR